MIFSRNNKLVLGLVLAVSFGVGDDELRSKVENPGRSYSTSSVQMDSSYGSKLTSREGRVFGEKSWYSIFELGLMAFVAGCAVRYEETSGKRLERKRR